MEQCEKTQHGLATSTLSTSRSVRKWLVWLTVANIVICASTIAFVICFRTQRKKPRNETKTEARESSSREPSRDEFGLAFRRGGTAFTLGVDEGALRESVLAQIENTNDTAAIDAAVNERLSGDIDDRICAVLRHRLDGIDLKEAVVQLMKGHRFRVLLPGIDANMRAEVRRTSQTAAYLEFRLAYPQNAELCRSLMEKLRRKRDRSPNAPVGPEGYTLDADGNGFVRLPDFNEIVMQPGYKARLGMFGKPPPGYQFMLERNREGFYQPNYIRRRPELTGNELVSARVERDDGGRVVVGFKLNDKGAAVMRKVSSRNIGRQMAIVLDGEVMSAPVMQSEIGATGQICGGFTQAEAKRLAVDLNAGALPVPLTILAEESFVQQ